MVSFPDRLSPLAWLYAAGSSTVARLRAFLHTRAAVRRAGEQLGLQFIGARRSPFDLALGGMLSFTLFRRPKRNHSNCEHTDPLDAAPSAPTPVQVQMARVSRQNGEATAKADATPSDHDGIRRIAPL